MPTIIAGHYQTATSIDAPVLNKPPLAPLPSIILPSRFEQVTLFRGHRHMVPAAAQPWRTVFKQGHNTVGRQCVPEGINDEGGDAVSGAEREEVVGDTYGVGRRVTAVAGTGPMEYSNSSSCVQ